MQNSAYRRHIFAVAIFAGLFTGSFAIASAALTGDESPPAKELADVPVAADVSSVVFAPTTGLEERMFSSSVSGRGSSGGYSIDSATDAGVCVGFERDNGESGTACFDTQTVSTGIAYGLFETAGGASVFGVVPDEVDEVSVGGERADLSGNLWTIQLDNLAPRSLVVTDLESGHSAALGAAG